MDSPYLSFEKKVQNDWTELQGRRCSIPARDRLKVAFFSVACSRLYLYINLRSKIASTKLPSTFRL